MNKMNKLSIEQQAYVTARALYETAKAARVEFEKKYDATAAELGIPGPYAVLPDEHPLNEPGAQYHIRITGIDSRGDAADELAGQLVTY